MQDKYIETSPAKINLFLKIINKRKDGFHNIRSGITFINLYDEVIANKSSKFEIKYIGNFAPSNNKFEDCIIEKLFSKFNLDKPNYQFTVNKNIPIQSGLGSASSNVAAVIRILNKMGQTNVKNNNFINLGADIPLFINNSDCLIRGIGEIIINKIFPKYYFLLIKPKINFSTTEMYERIRSSNFNFSDELDTDDINDLDNGNDFQNLAIESFEEIKEIFKYLDSFQQIIFTSLTGSGSCIFGAFEFKKHAEDALLIFKKRFPNLWSTIVENNIIGY